MTTEPSAHEFERRYRALLARASTERGNEACVECERCRACNSCTFCKDSERLLRCHFCVRCSNCQDMVVAEANFRHIKMAQSRAVPTSTIGNP